MRTADIASVPDRHGVAAALPAAELAASMRWLSGMCDGAHSRDGAGFSRFDKDRGWRLAERTAERWTSADMDLGRHLAHKYRAQLRERPPLSELAEPDRAATAIGRLNGTDDVEVIAVPPVASLLEARQDRPPIASNARGGSDEAVSVRTTRDRGERVPSARQPADRPGRADARRSMANGIWGNDGIHETAERSRRVADGSGFQLDGSQRAALDLIRRSPVAILTGGPGTGKTTITRVLVREALAAGHKVSAMAPTGIAAKRLADSIGYDATTIHRALGAVPQGEGVLVVQPDQAAELRRADLVVVDETSMVTSRLFAHLLGGIGPRTRLLLIGDADQLAPVGSGQPFVDAIDSRMLPVATLTTVHRQAEGSRIREACDLVRSGQWYGVPPQASRDADLVWLEEESEEVLADMCEEILVQARAQYAADEITLLTPRVTAGMAGNVTLRTEELNRRLQRRLNPGAGGLGGIATGDPVICGSNRPKDGVWNGTGGTAVMADGRLVMAVTGEDRCVDCIEDCELAYAVSVHRYQGSQNRVIVVAAHPSGGKTLTRRLLYTAISRAQERCICLGPRAAFEAATANVVPRRTLLGKLLEKARAPELVLAPQPAPAKPSRPSLGTILARNRKSNESKRPAFWKTLPKHHLGGVKT